ncbi:MAG TPA: haloacid dehalogenase-like hydrolase [Longimicrobiales bacterium]|nr:haloacid dehalogenase-like hydrolase [Longimicrobiales bacterium]
MKRLVLFDIDGTLLTTDGAPRRAFHRAMLEVYRTAGPIATHAFDGKTDPQIARELLTHAGLPAAAVERGFAALWSVYLRELSMEFARPGSRTTVLPGISGLLQALEARADDVLLGLLTGNIEEGAALKLASAGIRSNFRIGAFGSDCEQRDGLPPVAVERARAACGVEFSRTDIVIIGDTPSDVTCGRALGARAIGVGTGRYHPDELLEAGAAAVFMDLARTDDVLQAILS